MEHGILLRLGYICNNNCRFCHQYNYRKMSKDFSFNEIKKKILEIKKMGISRVLLTGGEPTIRSDIFKILELCKKENIIIELGTNARMFKNFLFAKKFCGFGLRWAQISLHGSCPIIHNYLVRVQGSFGQTIQGIKNLLDLGVKVRLNVVINKKNINDLKNIIDLCFKEFPTIKKIKFSFIIPEGVALNNFNFLVPKISLAAKKVKEAREYASKKNITISTEGFPFCIIGEREDNLRNIRILWRCEARDGKIEHISKINDNEKTKSNECLKCPFFHSLYCEGIYRNYIKRRGSNELLRF